MAFAIPAWVVGGSVQALTTAPGLTASCWLIAAIGVHLFAAPFRTAPDPLLRAGLVFLLMALGPLSFLIWGTMILWNR